MLLCHFWLISCFHLSTTTKLINHRKLKILEGKTSEKRNQFCSVLNINSAFSLILRFLENTSFQCTKKNAIQINECLNQRGFFCISRVVIGSVVEVVASSSLEIQLQWSTLPSNLIQLNCRYRYQSPIEMSNTLAQSKSNCMCCHVLLWPYRTILFLKTITVAQSRCIKIDIRQ